MCFQRVNGHPPVPEVEVHRRAMVRHKELEALRGEEEHMGPAGRETRRVDPIESGQWPARGSTTFGCSGQTAPSSQEASAAGRRKEQEGPEEAGWEHAGGRPIGCAQ